MASAVFAYTVLWLILVVYAVLSSIDFGAGFYYWLAGLRPGHERVRTVTLSYLSPVWETTSVFLVLFFVGMIGFFPPSVRIFATALYLPLSLAVIVMALRGAFFAFHHVAPWADRFLAPVFGLGGLLVPALLVSYLSSAEDGAIHVAANGAVSVSQARLWLSPLNIVLALLAMAAATYLSATFLAHFARRRSDTEVAAFYRVAASRAGIVTGMLAVILALVLRATAPFHFATLATIWPLQLLAVATFAMGLWALLRGGRRRSGLALVTALGTFSFALLAFGLTRLPYLLYPTLRVDAALTPPATYTALVVTVVGGTLLIAPALWLLYLLFVRPPRKPQSTQPAPGVSSDAKAHDLSHSTV